MRLSEADRELLELAADTYLEGAIGEWPRLRALFQALGAPARSHYHGALIRQIAGELLVELEVRPRPDGPLRCWTPDEWWRTHRRPLVRALSLRDRKRRERRATSEYFRRFRCSR